MTGTAIPVAVPASRGHLLSDIGVMTKRNLMHYRRRPQLIVFATIQPIMFFLLMAFVFGGAVSNTADYINFLAPGIFVQTVLFGSTQTTVGLAEDLTSGMVNRFRSLPMARSALLMGRTLADSGRNLFALILMIIVGHLFGFRFQNGFVHAAEAMALVLLFGFAFSWISATIGIWLRDAEAAQAAAFVWIFPLVFIFQRLRADVDHAEMDGLVRRTPAGHGGHRRRSGIDPGTGPSLRRRPAFSRRQPIIGGGVDGGDSGGVRAACGAALPAPALGNVGRLGRNRDRPVPTKHRALPHHFDCCFQVLGEPRPVKQRVCGAVRPHFFPNIAGRSFAGHGQKQANQSPLVPVAGNEGPDVAVRDAHVRSLNAVEGDIIRAALAHYDGRMAEVARRLAIGRSTLYRKVRELGIEIDAERSPGSRLVLAGAGGTPLFRRF